MPYRQSAESGDVLELEVGPDQVLAPGDRVVVLQEDRCLAMGTVQAGEGGKLRTQLEWLELELPKEGVALVFPRSVPAGWAGKLPPQVFLAERMGQGEIGATQVARSAETDRHNLAVIPQQEGLRYGLGDRLDFYRDGRYVAFGTVVDVTPGNAMVEILASLSPLQVEPGDYCIRRPAAGLNSRVRGYLFRQEADHALVSLGEADGIEVGQVLFGRSGGGEFYRLGVERVYRDHCAARLEEGGAGVRPQLWDPVGLAGGFAVALELPAEAWQPLGAEWLITIPPCGAGPCAQPGDFVYCREHTPGVGIVLSLRNGRLVAYAGGGWTVAPFRPAKDGHGDEPKTDTGVGEPTTQAVDDPGGV